jgi:hypothetical protein
VTSTDDTVHYPTGDPETEFVLSSTPDGTVALLTDRSRPDAWFHSTHTVPVRR